MTDKPTKTRKTIRLSEQNVASTMHMIRLSQRDRERVELIGAVYGFPVSAVHRAALRVLFSLTGLSEPSEENV